MSKRRRPSLTLLLIGLTAGLFLVIQAYFIRSKFDSEKVDLIIGLNETLQTSVSSFRNYYSNHNEFESLLNVATNSVAIDPDTLKTKNLLENADLNDAYSGFETEYSLLDGKISNFFPNKFGWIWITDDPKVKTNSWTGHGFGDNGNFLLVDGAAVPERKFWKERIRVSPDSNYVFSFYITSVIPRRSDTWKRALVEVMINGQRTGYVLSPSDTTTWKPAAFIWHSGKDTIAEISMRDINSGSNYNDFGIDHLTFKRIDRQFIPVQATKEVKDSLKVDAVAVLNEIFEEDLGQKNIHIGHKLELFNATGSAAAIDFGRAQLAYTNSIGHYYDFYFIKADKIMTNYFFIDGDHYVQCEILDLNSYLFNVTENDLALFGIMLISSIVLIIFIRRYLIKQSQIADLKYQLVNNINHELKTPIATLSVAIEALQTYNQIENKAKTAEYLSIAKKQIKKLDQIIDSSFQLSKVEDEAFQLQMESIDLQELIEELLSERQEELAGKAKIEYGEMRSGLTIQGDRIHLKNIISTIIDNAVKYAAGIPEIKISVFRNGTSANVSIRDNGIGIDKKYHKLIFDKFFRVPSDHQNTKGHGLGLSYVKIIMKLHHAKTELISELNKGTELILKFKHE